eukprot:gene37652-45738_t
MRALSLSAKAETLRIAVIGSGPSAFYATKYLLAQHPDVGIDMFEKLPFPYGLVRYGVAPDHPEVKSVSEQFHEIAKTNAVPSSSDTLPRYRYFGNVEISDYDKNALPFSVLQKHYSAVLLAYGASDDHSLHIPNEHAKHVYSARHFVNWYNGHPDYRNIDIDFDKIRNVCIVGQGNVALDCARILAKSSVVKADGSKSGAASGDTEEDGGVGGLDTTDISDRSLELLRKCPIENIYILGRRGHVQSAYTIKELRELTKIPGVQTFIHAQEMQLGLTPSSAKEAQDTPAKKRILQLMEKIAKDSPDVDAATLQPAYTDATGEPSSKGKTNIWIRFLLSPKEVVVSQNEAPVATGVKVCRTALVGDAHAQKAVDTSTYATLPCDLVLKAIGYKSVSIADSIPFDAKKHVVKNVQGRVTAGIDGDAALYVTGWLKRGPSGIIGTNIGDARETVQSIVEDVQADKLKKVVDPWQRIIQEQVVVQRGIERKRIGWADYEKLNAEEVKRGESCNPPKPRQKIVGIEEALQLLER